ncbi:uncharacterized protein LOC132727822 [Ruditapes philippinarum]|uniref:uncharacterized protein LOC132727822 n=1 Tax=Ruditapes philippinarum TaxID=129788 RepID=UPI00295A6852|nr:uncharacterized protein LOC132727822 [Ruditapes philippinarum]
MKLVDIQTYCFIIAFLFVAFAALVMAWSKRFPIVIIRRLTKREKKIIGRSTKTMTVPVSHEEHDQTSLRKRRSTAGTQPQPPDKTTIQTASLPARAPTPPRVIHLQQQQLDMAQQLTMEQGKKRTNS